MKLKFVTEQLATLEASFLFLNAVRAKLNLTPKRKHRQQTFHIRNSQLFGSMRIAPVVVIKENLSSDDSGCDESCFGYIN
jgi:hypothetical protein